MKKHTSLMEARAIVGTCPDMCPEKERYRRQDTHRLSYFEVTPDSEPRVSSLPFLSSRSKGQMTGQD